MKSPEINSFEDVLQFLKETWWIFIFAEVVAFIVVHGIKSWWNAPSGLYRLQQSQFEDDLNKQKSESDATVARLSEQADELKSIDETGERFGKNALDKMQQSIRILESGR